ncbi:MAG: hypothetical protein CYPHOPRED_002629, partial [Cyphobasidiales sp. Tagirdzhanova-0007]
MPASTFGRSISKRKLSILVAALMAICGVVTAIRFHATGQKRLTDAAAAPWTSVVQPMLGDSSSDAAWSQVQDWEILSNSSVLHRTCLTHQERYALYDSPLPSSLPLPPTHTSTVLLLRVRPTLLLEPIDPDFLLHIRALIAELQGDVGIDVYLVTNIDVNESSRNFLKQLPLEFRERTFVFHWEDLTACYPEGTFANVVFDNHASINWFLESPSGQQYSFAWYLEEDVRSTGSWSNLFNHINASIPRHEPPAMPWELRSNLIQVNRSGDGIWQPDLILTGYLDGAQFWEDLQLGVKPGRCGTFMKPKEIGKAFVQFVGISRRMHDIMTKYYQLGYSCYFEAFPISVAKKHGLAIAKVTLPGFKHVNTTPRYGENSEETWTWDASAATPYYQDWA